MKLPMPVRFLTSFFRRPKSSTPAATVTSTAKPGRQLAKIFQPLVVLARRSQGKLLAGVACELGPAAIIFNSTSPVVEGEALNFEFRLSAESTILASGQVEWVVKGDKGYTAQAILWTSPEQKRTIVAFIEVSLAAVKSKNARVKAS